MTGTGDEIAEEIQSDVVDSSEREQQMKEEPENKSKFHLLWAAIVITEISLPIVDLSIVTNFNSH